MTSDRGHTWTEEWRRECEARSWLSRGYDTRAKVEPLMERIAKKRGQEAADQLREAMRAELRRRVK